MIYAMSGILIPWFLMTVIIMMGCGSSGVTTEESGAVVQHSTIDSLRVLSEIRKFRENFEQESDHYNKIRRKIEADSKTALLTAVFSDAEEIKKMSINYPAKSSSRFREYLFNTNDYLMFVEESEFYYSDALNKPDIRLLRKVVNEYYFIDNTLFYWIRDKHKVSGELYQQKSAELFADLKIILDQLSPD